MKKSILLVFIFWVSGTIVSFAQYDPNAEFPEVGKRMPDFTIRNLEDYPKNIVSLADFKGKWLILDFWSKYCAGCIESFPKMNALYEKYKDKVQLVEVCYLWREGGEHAMYTKFKTTEHLTFPVAYDSLLCQRFNISGVPHLIIVDSNGIVRGITNQFDENDMSSFLSGKTPVLTKTYTGVNTEPLKLFDRKKPLLINGNGGADTSFVFRFVLAKYNKDAGYLTSSMKGELVQIPSRIELTNATLRIIYFYAFTGHYYDIPFEDSDYQKFYPVPLIETKDSLLFKNKQESSNMFSFSLSLPALDNPEQNIEQFKKVLQQELAIYFGYYARVETRKMPYYKLIVTDSTLAKRIKTKDEKPSTKGDWSVVTYINQPLSMMLDRFSYGHINGPIVIDETGITSKIDLKLDVPFDAPWNQIRVELKKVGLDLIPSIRPIKVLVISDSENTN